MSGLARGLWLSALAGWLLVGGPAEAAPLEEVKRRGELRVGADPAAGAPYFYRVGEGYAGFEADVARAIARQLGVKAVFVPTPYPTLLTELAADRFDVVLNATEIAPLSGVRFTGPYYVASQALLVKADHPRIYGMQDLPGKQVGTTQGSVAEAVLRHMKQPAKVTAFPDTQAPFQALAAGKVEAVLLESAMVRWHLKQQPGKYRVAGLPLLPRPYGAVVSDDDLTLLEGLNGVLAALRKSGELKRVLSAHGLWDSVQEEAAKPTPAAAPKR